MFRALLIASVLWTIESTCFAIGETEGPTAESEQGNLSSLELQMLQKGARAPWTGILILQDDLVQWRFKIEALEFELQNVRQLHTSILKVEKELTERKIQIERERTTLIQELWKAQVEKLGKELQKTQEHLLRAQEIDWWEHPAFWLAIGVVITSGAGLLVLSISGK